MKELFERGCDAISARAGWEARQRLYYELRHDGLRRRNKPWPTASDLHFPLVDMNIRKAKPFWEAQATSADRLATFVSLQPQQEAASSAAADYFDFELKQHSNFETELIRAIDGMLLRGRGVLKVTVDPFQQQQLVAAAIDLPFILMLGDADDFDEADGWIEVRHLSVAAYKRDRRFDQDEATIHAIRGSKDLDVSTGVWQDKEVREGVNFSRCADQIILWEHWERTSNGWTVYTYSPHAPERSIRDPFTCPYRFQGKPSCPYFSFKMEVKDKGWYSPRGLAEVNAAFEQYATKLWNEKADAMTLTNRPVLTSDQAIPSSANLRWMPGEFIPGGIKGVPMPQPPFSFDQEIAFARSTAEQQSMMPDFGIMEPQKSPGQGAEEPTATKTRAVTQLSSVGTESNGRLFRRDLAKVYRHVWGLLLQYRREALTYFVAGELKTLPEQALHDAYLIIPDGSPDQWNKQLRQQRADARLAKFANHPNVNQEELAYDSLSADDALVAQKLFVPGNVRAASEQEDEAVELLLLEKGYPAAVKPNEDHAARIYVLMTWLQAQDLMGAPVNPASRQRVQEHLAVHFQHLKALQPEAAKQVAGLVAQQELPATPPPAAMNLEQPIGIP